MVKKKKETVLSLLREIRDFMFVLVSQFKVPCLKPFMPKSDRRFTMLEDNWIKDDLLGLDWGPSSDRKMTWEEAKKYCLDNGGRLPEIEELSRLVDYKHYNPSINKEFFPDTKTDDWYWTNTQHADWPDYAWIVYFNYGSVHNSHKDYSSDVRPVRPSK